jgi:hypothetical protein
LSKSNRSTLLDWPFIRDMQGISFARTRPRILDLGLHDDEVRRALRVDADDLQPAALVGVRDVSVEAMAICWAPVRRSSNIRSERLQASHSDCVSEYRLCW